MPARATAPRAPAGGRLPARRAQVDSALAAATENAIVEIDGHAIAFTHLDRVYWPAVAALGQPAITKRDFLRYLLAVAPLILPEIRDRPLTLFRWPEGLARRRVLEKH